MGARAQVHIEDENVYLYTHWGSGNLVNDVKTALSSQAGRNRWNDPEYLARVIFDVMQNGEQGGEIGFGIGGSAHDDLDYDPIEINCANQTVTVNGVTKSFADFVAQ